MSQRTSTLDFNRMIQEARMQRTAEIGHAIVQLAHAVGNGVRRLLGLDRSHKTGQERRTHSRKASAQPAVQR